jgi:surface antigen
MKKKNLKYKRKLKSSPIKVVILSAIVLLTAVIATYSLTQRDRAASQSVGEIPYSTWIKLPTSTPTPTPTPIPSITPTPQDTDNGNPNGGDNGNNGGNNGQNNGDTGGTADTDIAKRVEIMANSLNAACNNTSIYPAVSLCLTKTNPALMQGVLNQLNYSVQSNYYLQCVGFVRAASVILGQDIGGGYNANGYAGISLSGYKWYANVPANKMQPNDIVIYSGGAYGHIAYVISVEDNNNFTVAEANFRCNGCVGIRHTTRSTGSLAGWHRKI